MRLVLLTALAATFTSILPPAAAAPTAPSLQELGRLSLGFAPATTGPYAIADFDHDGIDDIVLAGNAGPDTLLQVYGRRSGTYVSKQMLVVPGYQVARVLAHAEGGAQHLYAITQQGTVQDFTGWPLHLSRSFDLGVEVGSAAIGDIDHDGHDELVVGGGFFAGVWAFDLASGAQRWSEPAVQAQDLLLLQLDADPALEIVCAGTPGIILDGATHATDWTYKDGFGNYLAAYHAGATPQFVVAHAWDTIAVFQGGPYSPLWDVGVFNVGAVAAYDFDGDGKDELIEGDAQWGSVNLYDGQTHAIALSIPHDSYSSSAVAAVDLEGDGVKDIAYSPTDASYGGDLAFALYDATDGSTKWDFVHGPSAPYGGASVAATGPGGALRFLFGATLDIYSDGTAWAQIDGTSGASLWQSALDDPTLPTLPTASISVADIGAGSGFIVAGEHFPGSSVVAMDDATHTVRWQIDGASGHPLEGRSVVAMAAVPRASGAPDTGLMCTDEGGSRLFMFGLADGHIAWQSVLMNGHCRNVMAGDFGGGTRLVVAVLEQALRAYDANTHLLAWSLPVDADGASLLDGVSGREFAVFKGAQLTFYNAATRAVLRQFDLGQPIQAVQQLDNIHTLAVSAGGRLLIVDGADGQVKASSDFLGSDLAAHNQLTTKATNGQWFVGAVSSAGAFRYRIAIDQLFANGFDG